MAFVKTDDDVKLYYEETGQGLPIVFVHEFGGDFRSWEPQVRHFSRRYRCITFNARGYPPSDVPDDVEAYSQQRAMADIDAVMAGLGIAKAHIVGLSMGGFATLHFGLNYPDKALSITIAGTGYGAEKQYEDYFRQVSLDVAARFESQGSKKFAETYAMGPSRVQFLNKDPRGWREFSIMLSEHSAQGSANTMRGVQARRPSIYDLEEQLADMSTPALIISGDEDDHCLQPGLFLKRAIPASGLCVFPKTGHALNLEEPEMFNRTIGDFLSLVEAGRWLRRDPRARADQIMKTD
jgi:pimeloyl-ACP methyl ester carboxylesterase